MEIVKLIAPDDAFLMEAKNGPILNQGAREKQSIFKVLTLNNQGGTLGIFALVPPPDFGHKTPLHIMLIKAIIRTADTRVSLISYINP